MRPLIYCTKSRRSTHAPWPPDIPPLPSDSTLIGYSLLAPVSIGSWNTNSRRFRVIIAGTTPSTVEFVDLELRYRLIARAVIAAAAAVLVIVLAVIAFFLS